MLLRELLHDKEQMFSFFAGQNLDSEVRIAAQPGVVEVVLQEPAKEAPASEGDK